MSKTMTETEALDFANDCIWWSSFRMTWLYIGREAASRTKMPKYDHRRSPYYNARNIIWAANAGKQHAAE